MTLLSRDKSLSKIGIDLGDLQWEHIFQRAYDVRPPSWIQYYYFQDDGCLL